MRILRALALALLPALALAQGVYSSSGWPALDGRVPPALETGKLQ